MSFILLLILSLASMVTLESHTSGLQRHRLLAKENALLGLKIALAELQKYAGPDQRITGTAGLLDSAPDTADIDSVNQPYWTGVWDQNGNLLTWLVSGNVGLSPNDDNFVEPVNGMTNTMGSQTKHIYSDGSVTVPLTQTPDGAYAYWISDEGVKAKASLAVSTTDDALTTAQKFDISQMSDLTWVESVDSDYLQRATTVESLKISASSSTEISAIDHHRHDLTTHSYGLLTNTVEGGLKQDLTLAFFDDSSSPSGHIFEPAGNTSSITDPGGPLWAQLKSWATTSINNNGTLTAREQTNNQSGIAPIVTLLQVYIVPRYQDNGDDTASVILHILPAITLWNPYNRTLDACEYYVTLGKTTHMFTSPEKWYYDYALLEHWKLFTTPDSRNSITTSNDSYKDNLVPYAVDCRLTFSIPNVSLAPGEAKTFSAPGNSPFDLFQKAYPASGQNELAEGFNASGSYYYDTGRDVDFSSGSVSYYISAEKSGAKSFTLVKRTDSEPQTLQEIYYLGGNLEWSTPDTNMLVHGGPITDLTGSVGIKYRRTFVADNDDASVKWLAHYNPRAIASGMPPSLLSTLHQPSLETTNNPSYTAEVDVDGAGYWDALPTGNAQPGVGYSNNAAYVNNSILFEASPGRAGLQSIGQLMHANLFYDHSGPTYNAIAKLRLDNGHFDNLLPAYAIGNSLSPPHIALNSTYVDWTEYPPLDAIYNNINDGIHYDYSYWLNRQLWDRYFFSSLPSLESRVPKNPRLLAVTPDNKEPLDSQSAAVEFMVDGAFNVNSTSEEAWRALLGAFFGESVDGIANQSSPFLRLRDNPGARFDITTNDAEDAVAYHGYRDLNRDQIANLARQITKQVKWRAFGRGRPFTSLADFVNRDPNTDAPTGLDPDAFRLQGALSAAINASDMISPNDASDLNISDIENAKINAALAETAYETTPRTENGFQVKTQEGWTTEGIPAWLTQADILARLGSVISVRSDTFKIRAYGESKNPINDQIISTAWCEAIVQRLPEYLDRAGDSPSTKTANLQSQTNKEFGRRFVIVDFRWIEHN